MEPEGCYPRLQVAATCPYPEPDQSNPPPPLPEDPSDHTVGTVCCLVGCDPVWFRTNVPGSGRHMRSPLGRVKLDTVSSPARCHISVTAARASGLACFEGPDPRCLSRLFWCKPEPVKCFSNKRLLLKPANHNLCTLTVSIKTSFFI